MRMPFFLHSSSIFWMRRGSASRATNTSAALPDSTRRVVCLVPTLHFFPRKLPSTDKTRSSKVQFWFGTLRYISTRKIPLSRKTGAGKPAPVPCHRSVRAVSLDGHRVQGFFPFLVLPFGQDADVAVAGHARAGRNQLADDDVLLQAEQLVDLALDGGIGEHPGRF